MEIRKVVLAALLLFTQTSFAFSNSDPNSLRVRPDSLSKPCTKVAPLNTTAPVASTVANNTTLQTEVGFQGKTNSRTRGF